MLRSSPDQAGADRIDQPREYDRQKLMASSRSIDVNLKGVLYGIGAALPHMKAQRSGHIINVSSVAGHVVRRKCCLRRDQNCGARHLRRASGSVLHIRRAKAGTPATHPLTGRELRALRRLQRETGPSTHLFMSERKAPISIDGYQKMVERLSVRAKLGFQAHAHMLRHACGFKLANDGVDTRTIQAYLGHKDIRHTVRYTELSPGR